MENVVIIKSMNKYYFISIRILGDYSKKTAIKVSADNFTDAEIKAKKLFKEIGDDYLEYDETNEYKKLGFCIY